MTRPTTRRPSRRNTPSAPSSVPTDGRDGNDRQADDQRDTRPDVDARENVAPELVETLSRHNESLMPSRVMSFVSPWRVTPSSSAARPR